MTKKTILITGGGGFLCSNFIRTALFNKSDYRFISIDYCKLPNVLNNIYVNKGHQMYIGNITDRHFIDVIFELERPDIVLHMAAESFVDYSINDTTSVIHSNILGTQVIIDACVKWKVKRLVYTSTDKVYGQLSNESEPSWTEENPLNPLNPYSASKASSELLIKAAYHTYGLEYNITRCCNNYGPRQQIRNFIPNIITNILSKHEVLLFSKGNQLREWMYVEDHYNALMTILDKAPANEIYNISANHEFSKIEVFHEICNIMERGNDLLKFVEDPKSKQNRYSVNSDKLKNLGWKPHWKFKKGLAMCINWYVNNTWFK